MLKSSADLSQTTAKEGESGFLVGIALPCCAVWGCTRQRSRGVGVGEGGACVRA